MPSTTIGFPHGGHATRVKVFEAERALDDGGRELDMVVNISKVLSGDWGYVRDDIRAVLEPTHARGARLKVIFENCYLEDAHKVRLCEISGELGADWVKTSTGFGTGGATDEDLALMRRHSPPHVQVKAAGGVRDPRPAPPRARARLHPLRRHRHEGHAGRGEAPAGSGLTLGLSQVGARLRRARLHLRPGLLHRPAAPD